jgi:hypothetical protein
MSSSATLDEIITARAIPYCFHWKTTEGLGKARCCAESGWADYSNIIAVPHEYFCPTRIARRKSSRTQQFHAGEKLLRITAQALHNSGILAWGSRPKGEAPDYPGLDVIIVRDGCPLRFPESKILVTQNDADHR